MEGCHVIKNRLWFVFIRATVGVRVRVIVGVGSEKYSRYAFRNSFDNKNVRTGLYLKTNGKRETCGSGISVPSCEHL